MALCLYSPPLGHLIASPFVVISSQTIRQWRREYGVSELSEESVKTGKSYLHDFLDVHERPVLMVEVSKHVPGEPSEDELSVFLIEKALGKIPEGKDEILTIIDLQGFSIKNADLNFIPFLVRYETARKEYFTQATVPASFRN